MKNWIISALIALSAVLFSHAQITPVEQWTYNGSTNGDPLSSSPSLITGSAFGTGAEAFLKLGASNALFQASGAANEGYSAGLTGAAYAGQTNGIYQIFYDVLTAGFFPPFPPPAPSGQLGYGLRSNVNGPNDCKVYFRQLGGRFELVVHDASGERPPVLIEALRILSAPVNIRQVYFLDERGNPGSFKVYYTLGDGAEQEILPGQLTLHADFQLDEFLMQVDMTSNGFTWKTANIATVDNLMLAKIEANPELSFLQENVSFIDDNGIFPGDTYEPGDVLQIITTNQNTGFAIANDVSTSLSAPGFSITPASVTIGSVDVGEQYTAAYQVTILDNAANDTNVFTVVNQIGTGADAVKFESDL